MLEDFIILRFYLPLMGKLPDDISFKKSILLIKCVRNDNKRYYSQIFLKEVLYDT